MNFHWARPTDLAWGLAAGLLAEGSGLPEVLQDGCAGKERLYKEPKGYGERERECALRLGDVFRVIFFMHLFTILFAAMRADDS